MSWQPTNELRWIKRDVVVEGTEIIVHRVLQQKWTSMEFYDWEPRHEWRDVPEVTEGGKG